MRPLKGIYHLIYSTHNLYRAAHLTLRQGRRYKGEGALFRLNGEKAIIKIQHELKTMTYRHGRYFEFKVYDPKERLILAAPIKDRVVHHALHDIVEPRIDPKFIHDSYACRVGKGTHKGIERAQQFLNACQYALHLDVKKYFPSINHRILKAVLQRHIADEKVLWLFQVIIDSSVKRVNCKTGGIGSSPSMGEVRWGRRTVTTGVYQHRQKDLFHDMQCDNEPIGLPIGNLTSQFLANLYLNELDQFVKHRLKCRYYIRYMDDMVFFSSDKAYLKGIENDVRAFCREELRLKLHDSGCPIFYKCGLQFLGFRIYRRHIRIKSGSVNRFIRRMKHHERQLEEGQIDEAKVFASIRSWDAHAAFGDTYQLRRKLYAKFEATRPRLIGWYGDRNERDTTTTDN